MPPRRAKPCRHAGCAAVSSDKSGFCDAHRQATNWGNHQAGLSRHQRGYGVAWEKLRRVILQRDQYLCQTCLRDGIYTAAYAVDHIKAKAHGGTDDPVNLESMCRRCHDRKTARERCERAG